MLKIEIKSVFGSVLFSYEKENNTIKDTLEEAIRVGANLSDANLRSANLSYANLSYANLSYANLSDANLSDANLRSANLSDANLSDANLSDANLLPFKLDMFDVLLRAIPEVPAFITAIKEGRIDGSTYEGACACLCGTLMKSEDKEIVQRVDKIKSSSRPIEVFFMNIKKGDTPETNPCAKLALEWAEEFLFFINYQKQTA